MVITITTTHAKKTTVLELHPKVVEMISKLASTGLYGKDTTATVERMICRYLVDNIALLDSL